ncbi:hypothetical protein TRFO_15082 [Tritrichomonas foetus]|uniref:Leucine Rich Repeat family protein n=1 Tax=Tritrichomonas foetus TaxID=1144522 RepID=A0A1J4KTC2_9EUKA|nr:hypothetical protein TRFO_15082 [Tritrichomonas foetus]|eukprot:OHT14543.1 hypothetical protein TRFO_15082 [Tritrichomonas foetus]
MSEKVIKKAILECEKTPNTLAFYASSAKAFKGKKKIIAIITNRGIQARDGRSLKITNDISWDALKSIQIADSTLILEYENNPQIQTKPQKIESQTKGKNLENQNNDKNSNDEKNQNNAKNQNNEKSQKSNKTVQNSGLIQIDIIFQENFKQFFENLADVIQRILTKQELKLLNFKSFNCYPVSPTSNSIRARLLLTSEKVGISLSPQSMAKLTSLVLFQNPVLDINEWKNESLLIFDSLPLMKFVKSLNISEIKGNEDFKSVYSYLTSLLPQCKFLRHIEISNWKVDSFFPEFLNLISTNKKLKLSSLVFGEDSNLKKDDLELIQTSILESNIHSIGFNKAFQTNDQPNDGLRQFYSILNDDFCKHIWSLNLDHTKNLDFNILLPKLQTLTSLSFEKCHIDLYSFLRTLGNHQLNNLVYLNLSRNKCTSRIDTRITLPPSLSHIYVNNVSWSGESLLSFFDFIFRAKKTTENFNNLHISIANADAFANQWNSVFQFFDNVKFTGLHTLIWDNNPVSPSLFKFLKMNESLKSLSMLGCFDHNYSDIILGMAEYLKSAKNLENLSIRGSETAFLGEKFSVIVDAITDHPNLKTLNLSNSGCGNSGLLFFIPLLVNNQFPSLKLLEIDGMKPFSDKPEQYIELLTTFVKESKNIKISFPKHDLLQLLKENKISEEVYFEIRELFKFQGDQNLSENGEIEDEIPEEENYGNFRFGKVENSKLDENPIFIIHSNKLLSSNFPKFFEEDEHNDLLDQISKEKAEIISRNAQISLIEYDYSNEEEEEEEYSEPPQPMKLKISSSHQKSQNQTNNKSGKLDKKVSHRDGVEKSMNFHSTILDNYSPPVSPKAKHTDSKSRSKSSVKTESLRSNGRNLSNRSTKKLFEKNGLSTFAQQQIKLFKEENALEEFLPFPEIEAPSYDDRRWDATDIELSLDVLYKNMKDEKVTRKKTPK